MTAQRRPNRLSAVILAVSFTLVVSLLGAPSVSAAGGHVLPSGARPHGYSLTEITGELAFFTASGNVPEFYPDTPFQVLYTAEFNVQPDADGLFVSGTNSFVVMPGTMFFVPIQNATDSPPVAGGSRRPTARRSTTSSTARSWVAGTMRFSSMVGARRWVATTSLDQ